MRRKILSLCLPLLIGAPSLAPIAVQADRAAALASVLPDDCPEYTDVTEDLVDMGVNLDLYPELSEGDVQCLSLVEWGYTGEETAPLGFGLYLYLYDPMARDWATSGTVYVAFADTAETFYDNSFHGLRMTRIDGSGDGRFTKWRIDDASAAYLKLNPSVRKYLVGSCSLRTKSGTDLSFPLGVEFDWSGFPRSESNSTSTLSMEKTPFQAVRAEVQPFTSDIGGITGTQTRRGWQFLNDQPFRSDVNLFSVAFSLPKWCQDFGELYSVHYEYWKYRTDWIMSFNNPDDYEEMRRFVGKSSLGDDGNYQGDMPYLGYMWLSLFDMDDIEGVTLDDDYSVDGHQPYTRFYNNLGDSGHHELRVDNPSWVFHLDDDQWKEGHHYTSEELDAYASSYVDSDPSDDLPVLNSAVSNELFYVPSYSEDSLFMKYGHVDNSISREDLLGLNLTDMVNGKLNGHFQAGIKGINIPGHVASSIILSLPLLFWGSLFGGGYEIDNEPETIDYDQMPEGMDKFAYRYLTDWKATCPTEYSRTVEDDVSLLADYASDDPVVSYADEEYKEDIRSFVATEESQGKKVYRLTYDAGLSNSYTGWAGSRSAADGNWTAGNVEASKTDAVFDFHFIDFTFHDGDKVYTLPAASDPFDVYGPIDTNAHPESVLPTWAWILIGVVAIILILVVLSLLFPVLKPVVKGIGLLFQLAIDVVYLVLVWWWLAIVRKARGEELPKVWLFGKS